MKLTKSQLKQIIEEELKKVGEAIGGQGEETVDLSRDAPRQTQAATKKKFRTVAKKVGGQGISDLERGLMSALGDQLLAAAKVDNIAIGAPFRYAKLLSRALIKVVSKSQPAGEPLPQETSKLQSAVEEIDADPGVAPPTADATSGKV